MFLVSPTEKERKHACVWVQIEHGFGCFQVQFGLVVSTVWIGSEYGFVVLLDESASESHTQNSTRTAPYHKSWNNEIWGGESYTREKKEETPFSPCHVAPSSIQSHIAKRQNTILKTLTSLFRRLVRFS